MDNPNMIIDEIKEIYGLHKTSEIDCGEYIKTFYVDNDCESWIEEKWIDGSKHTLHITGEK